MYVRQQNCPGLFALSCTCVVYLRRSCVTTELVYFYDEEAAWTRSGCRRVDKTI